MPLGPSLLSLGAAALYGVVLTACLAAAIAARRNRQAAWHLRCWLAFALLLAALAILRVVDFEDLFRDHLREMLRSSGSYEYRRTMQRPIAIAVLGIAAIGFGLVVLLFTRLARARRDVAVLAGGAAMSAMLLILVLRLVSYSPLDRILFGPLKLHWIIDLGSALTIMGSAAGYIWLVRQRP